MFRLLCLFVAIFKSTVSAMHNFMVMKAIHTTMIVNV